MKGNPTGVTALKHLTLTALLLGPLASLHAAEPKLASVLPPELQRLLPPSAPYVLDAGSSETLLLLSEGPAQTTVKVAVTATHPTDSVPMIYAWSVSKPSDASSVVLVEAHQPQTVVRFRKPGTYFLRVSVRAGAWSDWQSVVIHVVSAKDTGLAVNRFSAPPAPGIHPRIFFNPEELPALRERLKNTVIGREQAKKLAVNSLLLRQGAKGHDPKSPLAKALDGSPLVGNVGYFASTSVPYQQLVAGDLKALGDTIRDMDGHLARLGAQMVAEALWRLIKEDEQGAKDLAAAITTWARIVTPTIKPEDDWQWNGKIFGLVTYGQQEMGRLFDKVGQENVGLCYDFIYKYMTPEQRDTVRAMIAKATAGRRGFGFEQDMNKMKPVLSIAVQAVKPDYRVLFFPYRAGMPLPKTTWNGQRGELALDFGHQRDTCQFAVNS